jgi:histidine triad (HIT) family protein
MDCIFCKIIAGEIPSKKVYENESIFVFEDINPAAPVHLLVVPKMHFDNLNNLNEENSSMMSEMFLGVKKAAEIKGIDEYRIIINNGKSSGQEVFHLHIHILGGKENMGPMVVR